LKSSACRNCRVALTDIAVDLSSLSLLQFICSDFDSTEGSNDYPTRDCDEADTQYALTPTLQHAPCCNNDTLISASMSMMAWGQIEPRFLEPDFLSPGEISLMDLLEIDARLEAGPPDWGESGSNSSTNFLDLWKRDIFMSLSDRLGMGRGRDGTSSASGAGLLAYTKKSIDTKGESLAQVIISRDQRMVGMELGAEWLDQYTSPNNLESRQVVWSLNANAYKGETGLWAAMGVLLLIGLAHEVADLYGDCLTAADLRSRLFDPFLVFRAATLVLPFLLQSLSHLSVSEQVTVTSYIIVLMSLRCFIELQVISPLKMVIAPVLHAMAQLGSVCFIIAFMGLILALLNGHLFGVADGDPFWTYGLAKMVKLLTSPPTMDEGHMSQAAGGEVLLYYWSTFIMRLVLGSFMVAILVGSFNAVRGRLASEKEMRAALPADYSRRRRPRLYAVPQLTDAAWYVLSARVDGGFGWLMRRKFKRLASTGRAVQCVGGRATQEFSQAQLVDAFGLRTAAFLVESYGVLPPAHAPLAPPEKRALPAEGEAEPAKLDAGEAEHGGAWRGTVGETEHPDGVGVLLQQQVASIDKRLGDLCFAHEQMANDLKTLMTAVTGAAAAPPGRRE